MSTLYLLVRWMLRPSENPALHAQLCAQDISSPRRALHVRREKRSRYFPKELNGLSTVATFLSSIIHQKHGLNHDNTKSQIFKVGHEIISQWLPWPKRKMQSWSYLVYLLVNHDRGVCLKHQAECHFSTFPHNVRCPLNYSIYLNHQLQWPCSLYLLCFGWNNIVGVPIFQIPCYLL